MATKAHPDSIALSDNARVVLERRYLAKDERGRAVETPEQLFQRVAHNIAGAEKAYGDAPQVDFWEQRFLDVMTSLRFLPNSPTLGNAGQPLQQLAACFVLPVEDSMEGIFGAICNMAVIHKSGGGTGFSFSRLRPAGDMVRSTAGLASGPVSFMKVFDAATEAIKQGGTRRGANMAILNVEHPDIEEFIRVKSDMVTLTNFNISVGRERAVHGGGGARRGVLARQPAHAAAGGQATGARDLPPHRRERLGERRPRPRLHRPGEPRQPDAAARPHRGDEPLRRAAAAALRVVHARLDQPVAVRQRRRARRSTGRRWRRRCRSASASSTTSST